MGVLMAGWWDDYWVTRRAAATADQRVDWLAAQWVESWEPPQAACWAGLRAVHWVDGTACWKAVWRVSRRAERWDEHWAVHWVGLWAAEWAVSRVL